MPDEQVFNLDDATLQSDEMTGFDANANSSEFPAPPPDGVHQGRIFRPADRPWKPKYNEQNKISELGTSVRIDLDRGGTVFDHTVSTRLAQNGGNKVGDIIRSVTGMGARSPKVVDIARELDSLLISKPAVAIKTQWEASCQVCKDRNKAGRELNHVVKRGMHTFPSGANSTQGYLHKIECDRCGGEIIAQARVVGYQKADPSLVQSVASVPSIDESPFDGAPVES